MERPQSNIWNQDGTMKMTWCVKLKTSEDKSSRQWWKINVFSLINRSQWGNLRFFAIWVIESKKIPFLLSKGGNTVTINSLTLQLASMHIATPSQVTWNLQWINQEWLTSWMTYELWTIRTRTWLMNSYLFFFPRLSTHLFSISS